MRTGSPSSSRRPFCRAKTLGQRDIGDHRARGRRARAEMRTRAERDAFSRIARQIELLCIGEMRLVAIGRAEHQEHAIFLHMDATADISKMKIVKSMFPATAGKYAGVE